MAGVSRRLVERQSMDRRITTHFHMKEKDQVQDLNDNPWTTESCVHWNAAERRYITRTLRRFGDQEVSCVITEADTGHTD